MPMREHVGRRYGRLPVSAKLALSGLFAVGLLLAIFFGVLWPLLDNTGPTTAEIDGSLPTHATVNQPLIMDLEITSDGDQTINPTCVKATFSKPVDFVSVNFQGIETFGAVNGIACGGMLATQESVSIEVDVVPKATGSIDASLVPTQRNQVIGVPLTGTIQVGSP